MRVFPPKIHAKFIVHNSKRQQVILLLQEVVEATKLKYSMEIHFSNHVHKLEILAELHLQSTSVILVICLLWQEEMVLSEYSML